MTAAQVTRRFLLLTGMYTLSASLIWSVNTLFLLEAGLGIGQVFVVNAAYTAAMVVAELPTGVVADTWGRRPSYLTSVAVLAAGTMLMLVLARTGQGPLAFAASAVVLGVGFTFYSGALESWMVDALNAAGGGDLDRVFARGQQATGAAMLVGTVAGGVLGTVDLALPFALRVVLLVGVFALAAAMMHEQGFAPRPLVRGAIRQEVVSQARVGVVYGWRLTGLRRLMLAYAVLSAFIYWGFYAAQPHFLDLYGGDAVWVVGLVTAGFSLATILGNQLVDWLNRHCRRRSTLLLAATLGIAVACVGLGLTGSFLWALVAFLAIGFGFGVIEPVNQAYIHTVTPSDRRATVASFAGMVGAGGGVGGQVSLGALADARSIAGGYLGAGAMTLVALPLLWGLRRAGGVGDQIVGRDQVEAACAAVGIPGISQVDPQPAPLDPR